MYVKFQEIVEETSTEPDETGLFTRVRVVRSDAVPKYPLLRIEDTVRRDVDGTEGIVSHVAMVADHVAIRLGAGSGRTALPAQDDGTGIASGTKPGGRARRQARDFGSRAIGPGRSAGRW